MVIVDTNIIIDHLRTVSHERKSVLRQIINIYRTETIAISMVTIQELYEGASTKHKDKEETLLSTLSSVKIIPYSFGIAKLAGELARDFNKPIEFSDAVIAATSIQLKASLATLNTRDFKDLPNIKLLDITQM